MLSPQLLIQVKSWSQEESVWQFGVLAVVVVTLFGLLVAIVKHVAREQKDRIDKIEKEAKEREERLIKENKEREQSMARAVGEMEQFQRGVLMNMVKTNQDIIVASTQAKIGLTTAVERNTEMNNEIRQEIHVLRESQNRRNRET